MISKLRFNLYFEGKKFEKQAVARAGNIFALAKEIIFILPASAEEARESSIISEHFKQRRKRILAVTVNDAAALVPADLYHETIVLRLEKLTKSTLPPKPVKQLLRNLSADIVFDLSGSEFPFFRYAARTIPASFYAGIAVSDAEKFFDFVFRPESGKERELYPGFLKSITMFERN
ncbi:MAG: hypothetical protein IT279_02475 [Ignavibacteriaceae bacterium]|nr:hypothetical protein [Ignavibacteriaceae bacterium]